MNSESKYKVVYLHKDTDGVVKYVGSGGLIRANQTHAKSDRGKEYEKYVNSNRRLKVEIVAENLSKLEAENLERELYDKYIDTVLNCSRPTSMRSLNKETFDEFLYYDVTSCSCLRWKVSPNNKIKIGSEVGYLDKTDGYYKFGLKGVYYKAHRIVAVLHNLNVENKVIDHIDRNTSNNRIENLRVVSQKENCQNLSQQKLSSKNTSGVRGVCYDKRYNHWIASWRQDGKLRCKCFSTFKYQSSEEAFNAAVDYRKQMQDLHYNIT